MNKKDMKELASKWQDRCYEMSESRSFNYRFRNTNSAWNHGGFNKYAVIGSVMEVFRVDNKTKVKELKDYIYDYLELGEVRKKTYKDSPLKDFEYCYKNREVKNLEGDKYLPGRDYEFLQKLFKEFAKMPEVGDEKLAEDFAIYRMFYQTYIGKIAEEKAKERLESLVPNGIEVRYADDKYDALYGVDLVLEKNNDPILAIQVKPISYMKKSCDAHEEQKILNITHNNNFKTKKKCDYIYIYYEKDSYKPVIPNKELKKLKKAIR